MPLFEFRCTNCGTEFEKLMRKAGMHEGVECPACHGSKVEEMLSTFASVAKGGESSGSQARCKPAGG